MLPVELSQGTCRVYLVLHDTIQHLPTVDAKVLWGAKRGQDVVMTTTGASEWFSCNVVRLVFQASDCGLVTIDRSANGSTSQNNLMQVEIGNPNTSQE